MFGSDVTIYKVRQSVTRHKVDPYEETGCGVVVVLKTELGNTVIPFIPNLFVTLKSHSLKPPAFLLKIAAG